LNPQISQKIQQLLKEEEEKEEEEKNKKEDRKLIVGLTLCSSPQDGETWS